MEIQQMDINKFIDFAKKNKLIDQKHEELIKYNLEGGKNFRSLLFLKTFTELKNKEGMYHKIHNDYIHAIGYTMELLQAYFLITDDIIDNSIYRRNKLCWYKRNDVGLKALNDCTFIFVLIQEIMLIKGNEIKQKEKYESIKTINLSSLKTWIGQLEDSIDKKCKTWNDVKKLYNLDFYNEIVDFKTCAYTVALPIQLGIIYVSSLAKDCIYEFHDALYDKNSHTGNIFLKIAFIMQFQDDYLNFFPALSGKSGFDIQERKITYFLCSFVSEVEVKNDKSLFIKYLNYENDEGYLEYLDKSIHSMIKNNYEETEKKLHNEIRNEIKHTDPVFMKIFDWILKSVYKRKK